MISERLKELRIKHNFSQRDIGNYLNISHVAYGDYERNRSYPDLDTIQKLCNLYKISIDYLLNDNLTDILIIPKNEYENLKKSIQKINSIIENIDKSIIDNTEKEETHIQNSFNNFKSENSTISFGNNVQIKNSFRKK